VSSDGGAGCGGDDSFSPTVETVATAAVHSLQTETTFNGETIRLALAKTG
jgi:hypothetical protein